MCVILIILAACCMLPVQCLPVADDQGNGLTDGSDADDPWLINQFVCPPILCGSNIPNDTQLDETKAAYPFFEGDIVLDNEQKAQLSKVKRATVRSSKVNRHRRRKTKLRRSKAKKIKVKKTKVRKSKIVRSRHRRAIVKPLSRLWQYGIIPFEIDQSLSDEAQTSIHRAQRHIESHTCLRFVHRRHKDKDYLMYINQPGCWSYVGRIGGMQIISLGPGCEKVGTAVHETCHALGFWHEQSRADRDKYIHILMHNVAPSGKDQFGKRSPAESYSKGYVYDYSSVMHYGPTYFSVNGRPTIEVKGIGKKLGLEIGQRKGLSDIDIAQLNAIYHCNDKHRRERLCSHGWEYYDGRCYKFVIDDPQQYKGARDGCYRQGSHLVSITSSHENDFIADKIKDKYPYLSTWRTGGRKLDGQFVWERRRANRHVAMTYTNWAAGHPGEYTTLVIDKVNEDNETWVWRGIWAGSSSKPELYNYPYICEKKNFRCEDGWVNWADRCYLFQEEKLPFDEAHRKCASRSSYLVHINDNYEDDFIKDYLIANYPSYNKWRTGGVRRGSQFYWYTQRRNYVRMAYSRWAPNNPGRYTSLVLTRYDGSPRRFVWRGMPRYGRQLSGSQKCGFICEKPAKVHCFRSETGDGRDYRGSISYTERGVTCQKWTSHYPHNHDYMMGHVHRDMSEGLGDHNYCRNPEGRRSRPWCYVPLKHTVWQYCDVSICKS